MKFFKLFSKVFFVAFFVLTFQANAVISLKVNNEAIEKNRILFFGFDSEDEKLQQDIDLIFSKITKNLRTTDLFQVIKQKGTYDSALFSLNKKKEVKEEDLEIDLDKKNQQTQTKPAANSLSVEAIPDFEKYLQAKIGAIIVGQFDYNED